MKATLLPEDTAEYQALNNLPVNGHPGPWSERIIALFRTLQLAHHATDGLHAMPDKINDQVLLDQLTEAIGKAKDLVGEAVLRMVGYAEPAGEPAVASSVSSTSPFPNKPAPDSSAVDPWVQALHDPRIRDRLEFFAATRGELDHTTLLPAIVDRWDLTTEKDKMDSITTVMKFRPTEAGIYFDTHPRSYEK
jgi:hypothetical protein